jgi:hypothetical protein
MNALTVVPATSVPASLAEAELDAALWFAEQEKSVATRRAHRSDWRIDSPDGELLDICG